MATKNAHTRGPLTTQLAGAKGWYTKIKNNRIAAINLVDYNQMNNNWSELDFYALKLKQINFPLHKNIYFFKPYFNEKKASALFNEAMHFYTSKNYNKALVYIEKTLTHNPYNAEAHKLLANIFEIKGDSGKAITHLRKASILKKYNNLKPQKKQKKLSPLYQNFEIRFNNFVPNPTIEGKGVFRKITSTVTRYAASLALLFLFAFSVQAMGANSYCICPEPSCKLSLDCKNRNEDSSSILLYYSTLYHFGHDRNIDSTRTESTDTVLLGNQNVNIEGLVKDTSGHVIENADVQIIKKLDPSINQIAETDFFGEYSVSITTPVEELDLKENTSIYGNGSKFVGIETYTGEEPISEVILGNTLGQIVKTIKPEYQNGTVSFEISGQELPEGTYTASFVTKNNKFSEKISINQNDLGRPMMSGVKNPVFKSGEQVEYYMIINSNENTPIQFAQVKDSASGSSGQTIYPEHTVVPIIPDYIAEILGSIKIGGNNAGENFKVEVTTQNAEPQTLYSNETSGFSTQVDIMTDAFPYEPKETEVKVKVSPTSESLQAQAQEKTFYLSHEDVEVMSFNLDSALFNIFGNIQANRDVNAKIIADGKTVFDQIVNGNYSSDNIKTVKDSAWIQYLITGNKIVPIDTTIFEKLDNIERNFIAVDDSASYKIYGAVTPEGVNTLIRIDNDTVLNEIVNGNYEATQKTIKDSVDLFLKYSKDKYVTQELNKRIATKDFEHNANLLLDSIPYTISGNITPDEVEMLLKINNDTIINGLINGAYNTGVLKTINDSVDMYAKLSKKHYHTQELTKRIKAEDLVQNFVLDPDSAQASLSGIISPDEVYAIIIADEDTLVNEVVSGAFNTGIYKTMNDSVLWTVKLQKEDYTTKDTSFKEESKAVEKNFEIVKFQGPYSALISGTQGASYFIKKDGADIFTPWTQGATAHQTETVKLETLDSVLVNILGSMTGKVDLDTAIWLYEGATNAHSLELQDVPPVYATLEGLVKKNNFTYLPRAKITFTMISDTLKKFVDTLDVNAYYKFSNLETDSEGEDYRVNIDPTENSLPFLPYEKIINVPQGTTWKDFFDLEDLPNPEIIGTIRDGDDISQKLSGVIVGIYNKLDDSLIAKDTTDADGIYTSKGKIPAGTEIYMLIDGPSEYFSRGGTVFDWSKVIATPQSVADTLLEQNWLMYAKEKDGVTVTAQDVYEMIRNPQIEHAMGRQVFFNFEDLIANEPTVDSITVENLIRNFNNAFGGDTLVKRVYFNHTLTPEEAGQYDPVNNFYEGKIVNMVGRGINNTIFVDKNINDENKLLYTIITLTGNEESFNKEMGRALGLEETGRLGFMYSNSQPINAKDIRIANMIWSQSKYRHRDGFDSYSLKNLRD